MKKLLLGACALSMAGACQAQITPGTQLFSGAISYSKTERESQSVTPGSSGNAASVKGNLQQFKFTPLLGYFASPNLAVGVQATVQFTKGSGFHPVAGSSNIYVSSQDKTTAFSLGPFGRYYTFLSDQVALYGQLGAGYQYSHYEAEAVGSNSVPYDGKGNGFYAQLLPGIVFFPTNKLGLELSLNGVSYTRNQVEDQNTSSRQYTTTQNDFTVGIGLTDVRLGISLYVSR